jgi:hypothetical protein
MDRETTTIMAGAIIALTLIGGWYLGGSTRAGDPNAPAGVEAPVFDARRQATYSPDDVRYKLQQEEEAYAKKHKGRRMPPPGQAPLAPEEETSENEAPPIEHAPVGNDDEGMSAEEPEIE